METIHLFVELLDQYFSNVCELDIVFHFNKVYALLDEFILAGEVQESSKKVCQCCDGHTIRRWIWLVLIP